MAKPCGALVVNLAPYPRTSDAIPFWWNLISFLLKTHKTQVAAFPRESLAMQNRPPSVSDRGGEGNLCFGTGFVTFWGHGCFSSLGFVSQEVWDGCPCFGNQFYRILVECACFCCSLRGGKMGVDHFKRTWAGFERNPAESQSDGSFSLVVAS